MTQVTPQPFRIKDGIDLDHPLNQWLKPSCEAIQVTADNADALMELCGGERAIAPGKLIALKGWTGNYQTAGVDDWIVWLGDGCRVIYANGFARNYEAAA